MATNVVRCSYQIERKLLLMIKKLKNAMDDPITLLSTMVCCVLGIFFLIVTISVSNSYHNVKEYELHNQKIVMQEAYENHDLNKVRYRVKIYSSSHDASGVPVWKYVKTVDYGHQKPDLRE